ncbi:hypothetical protein pipiens_009299 [Culex pipiens pipiens]|uniref:TIL domain-containing protein n=1 Tax=Culex pipiens pipiens TaxID=38569 RepID=A0ABD1DE98_CULPP
MAKIFVPICVAIALIGITSVQSSDEVAGTPCAAKCPSGTEIQFCPKNEKFQCCAGCVQPTCGQPDTSHIRCIRCPDECICRKGFIRLEFGGPCVRESECPIPTVAVDDAASTNSTSE